MSASVTVRLFEILTELVTPVLDQTARAYNDTLVDGSLARYRGLSEQSPHECNTLQCFT